MQLREVIKEFGELVGFQSLETNNNGVVHITINKIGDLFIDEKYSDESGGNIFVYFSKTFNKLRYNSICCGSLFFLCVHFRV